MRGHIRQCPIDKTYTLLDVCPVCGHASVSVHPAKYSPQDKYGRYRRLLKHAGDMPDTPGV
ncbi:MAG TPA: RNA-protein complex protein Nop10 [Methanocorpusculum sp.]|nr:RNA-protein complex protein Nop10 [Methanocorpusculum sp.]